MTDILMAVYNGENYLREQIESILAQSYIDWRLIMCDDCSEDSSYDIMTEYAEKYPERIICHKNDAPSGSSQANFMGMLKYAESEYIMFSDHDDVWLENKIRLTLQRMNQMESKYPDSPILVHGELEIVDSELNTTYQNFTEYQGLKPQLCTLNRLLTQNNVTGCTVMMNRKLLELVKDAPADKMLMHDWWFALAASAYGHIGFVATPLIKYRQHGGNRLGAVNNRSVSGAAQIVSDRMKTQKRISVTYEQAEAFYDYYKKTLPQEAKTCLETYLSIPEKNKLQRMFLLIKHRYLKQNFMAAVGQLIFC